MSLSRALATVLLPLAEWADDHWLQHRWPRTCMLCEALTGWVVFG
jgi:hypothetical protein